ncbi:Ferrous iron transport protein A [Desulfurella amilsii]|uniref:Ferrous iron transport protein A n=1 Tax=Desulfurella amilsii TaxID=1562698 RepID=A0A1X4XW12_9BACT|nr:FeoA domain-containing protein [Desulfurella amilsii]OSS41721.1 Ferrous iron transport protein A [Desulfurella amilsii]
MPLILANENIEYKVVRIEGGHGSNTKFLEMGLVPGTKLKVIYNAKGPIIVSINGSKYALGKGLASKIIVREAV